jgi:hypothetical protein
LTGSGTWLPKTEQKAVEIARAPTAFGYSGGCGTPGTYGVGQSQMPLYGSVPMMRARGRKAQADQVRAPQHMLQARLLLRSD